MREIWRTVALLATRSARTHRRIARVLVSVLAAFVGALIARVGMELARRYWSRREKKGGKAAKLAAQAKKRR